MTPPCRRNAPTQARTLRRLLGAFASVAVLVPALAADLSPHPFVTASPIDTYRSLTQQEVVACGEAVHRAWTQSRTADAGDRGCIAAARHVCHATFDAALRVVRKPDAREALQAYHFAFVTALDGIAPLKGEARDGYERRQRWLSHVMAHAWTRFELAE